MLPNMDPKQMKSIMEKMGIKSTDVDALRVVIECPDRHIIISHPQVTRIDAQGMVTFSVAGNVSEQAAEQAKVEITDDDVKLVMEQSGVYDPSRAKAALEESKGDIASAIMRLKEGS